MISVAAAQTSQSYSTTLPSTNALTPLQLLMNANGTNFFLGDFSRVLLHLQDDLQQLLPMLEALNRSTSLSNVLLSLDLWSATNVSISNPATGSTTTETPLTPATPPSINGTNIEALIAVSGNSPGFRGSSYGTNAFLITTSEQQGLRTLIILQHELERVLPIIESLQTNHFIAATIPPPANPTNAVPPVQR
jgi:hypothetical protein